MSRLKALKNQFSTRSFRAGGYSVFAAVMVIALAVVINILAGLLPANLTQLDTTSNQLFTISGETENLLTALDSDVTIYWVVQSGQEDATLEQLLGRYSGMSSHVTLVKKDPDVYPTFLGSYDVEESYNNSLVVESDQRYQYISYYDIYTYDYSSYYTTGSYDTSFDGEGAITSAIDYVTSDSLPKIYTLTGHGESAFSTEYESAVEKQNMELSSLSLISADAVPEDADCVFINTPQSDISEEELEMLQEYLSTGGNLILITDPAEAERPNLDALMEGYGVSEAEGIVIEGNSSGYAFGTPYYLLPEIEYHTITSPLISDGYYVLLPVAHGLTISEELPETVTVTSLLTTSSLSFSKIAGYDLNTYERESGDIDGPFALAVAITDTIDADTTSNLVWISSGAVLDSQTNQQVSGGNQDLFLNCLDWMCEHETAISIHAKSMSYDYLTMNSSAATMLTLLVLGVIPLGYLFVGIRILYRRKRK